MGGNGNMIGMVTLAGGDNIVLTDDGQVESTRPELRVYGEMVLKMYKKEYSPSKGAFGVGLLYQLAQELDGQVKIEEKEGPPPGTVY